MARPFTDPGMSGDAPEPGVGLTVGIVGHRLERISAPEAVQARLGAILRAIEATLRDTPGANAPGARLRLVSALAEGADQLAVAAAMEAGVPWDAILPFTPAEYEADFEPGGRRAAFHDLLTHAGAVLVLDGSGSGAERDRAYDAVGKALLDNCDVLLAVWDGLPGRGRGGTHDVVEEAVRRSIPVITVSPDGRTAALRLDPTREVGVLRIADLVVAPLDRLPDLVRGVVGEPATPPWPALTRPPRRSWNYPAYPLMLSLLGLGRKRAAEPADPTTDSATATTLEMAFTWWDQAAVVAAQAFRSAVLVNFALAAMAVMLAALSLFAGEAKWIFVLAEVGTIMVLLANTTLAGRRRWQERWLESREIAELLRAALMLRSVGVGRGVVAGDDGGWKAWYIRALARSQPLQAADLSDAAAASRRVITQISEQAAWNEATAHRMHLAGRRLERVGETLFMLVLIAAVGWLVMRVANPGLAHDLVYALTAVTAGLPAVATACYGIGVILDFEGIADRSRRMAAALRQSTADWEQARVSVAELQARARAANDIMLGDVAAWRLLAQGRRLKIPG